MKLYHEKQVGALCGVHCLNALLQGLYFSELDLAHIARDLDALEREVLGGEALAGHGNLDDSGMFSSQVLSKALELWSLQIVPFRSQAIREQAGFDPVKEAAFICNLHEHWFTLRRIDGEWWNLNSILPAPEPLSDFYLAAYLDSLVDQGYTIYIVRGTLPVPQLPSEDAGDAAGGDGRWFTPEEAREANKQAATARQRGKAHNAMETALARAAESGGALTLQPRKRGAAAMGAAAGSDGDDFEEDPELAAALAASLADAEAAAGSSGGAGPSGSGSAWGGGGFGAAARGGGGSFEEDEGPELAAALAASLEEHNARSAGAGDAAAAAADAAADKEAAAAAAEPAVVVPDEPEEGSPGVLTVALRLPDGVVTRRWRAGDTVDQLRAFAASQLSGAGGGGGNGKTVVLSTQFPRRVLEDGAADLAAAGVQDRSVLSVTLL